MRINHNIASLNTYRQLSMNNANGSKSLEKLSSGLRINRAGDDAAGLAISEKMRGQIRGLDQAARNAQDGISMIQTAEGALNETHSILQRMRELAVQSANDTNTANDRSEIQKEIDQLAIEITRIANDTEFNTQKLVNGGISAGGLGENKFHIGANANQALSISIGAMDAKTLGVSRDFLAAEVATGAAGITGVALSRTTGDAITDGATVAVALSGGVGNYTITFTSGTYTEAVAGLTGTETTIAGTGDFAGLTFTTDDLTTVGGNITIAEHQATAATFVGSVTTNAITEAGIDVSTQTAANSAITIIEAAITTVSAERSKLGAYQNRLEHTINNLQTSSENLTASESRIRDVDMAKEMMEFTKNNILTQAAQAMLAQANQQPQGVLQLLR